MFRGSGILFIDITTVIDKNAYAYARKFRSSKAKILTVEQLVIKIFDLPYINLYAIEYILLWLACEFNNADFNIHYSFVSKFVCCNEIKFCTFLPKFLVFVFWFYQ